MNWSSSWKSSKRPGKQRLFRYNAPKHIAGSFMNCHLAPDLRKKYNTRSIRIRKGDTVKILRGTFKGRSGKVESVNVKRQRVFITGVDQSKRDGGKSLVPIRPSAILIKEVDTTDKRRFA